MYNVQLQVHALHALLLEYISYSQDIRVLNFRIHKFRPKVSFIFSKKKKQKKKRPMMNAMTNK